MNDSRSSDRLVELDEQPHQRDAGGAENSESDTSLHLNNSRLRQTEPTARWRRAWHYLRQPQNSALLCFRSVVLILVLLQTAMMLGAFYVMQPVEHDLVRNWPRVVHLLDQLQNASTLIDSLSSVPWHSLTTLQQCAEHLEGEMNSLLELARNASRWLNHE